MALQMPFSKQYGGLYAFLFGSLSIALYDFVTTRIGIWTLITAFAYGIVGVVSSYIFSNREASRKNFVAVAALATIAYDALTGLTIGPLFFHQSFASSLIGQIPFTALHLFGNCMFAFLLSPAIYRYLLYEREGTVSVSTAKNAYPLISKPFSHI